MTETETPIEAGARALHDRTYAGLDVGLWERRTEAGRERFLGDARAVFASVGVEGLAEVLRAHRLARWEETPDTPSMVTLVCTCRLEFVMEEGMPDGTEEQLETVHEGHVAEAVVAWLTGGGA